MPPLFALAAAPTTANQGGLDARRLLDRLYQETVGQPMPPFCAAKRGKPYFANSPLHCSTPHRAMVFCALAETEVGLDAEQLGRPVRPALVKKVLSSQEYCLWQQAEDPDRLFLSLWTLKEATVKYTGDGLRGYPNHLSFDPPGPHPGGLGFALPSVGMGKPCGVFMRPPPPARGTGNQKIFLRFLSLP